MTRRLLWALVGRWLALVIPRRAAPDVLGNLREEAAVEAARRGRPRAAWWLLRETAALTVVYMRAAARRRRPPKGTFTMRLLLLGNQLRFAARALRRTPGFLLIASVTLAVGIGATTAVFGLVAQALLAPLPYPNASRLAAIAETRRTREISVSYSDFGDWRAQARAFEAMALFVGTSFTMSGQAGAERLRGQYVSADLFHVLGTSARLGRAFTPDDDRAGGARVVMLGDGLWRRRFGADSSVLGATIDLDGQPWEIVGVLPRGFDFPGGIVYGPAEIYAPLGQFVAANQTDVTNRGSHPGLEAIGLLAPGVGLAAARAELSTIAAGLARAHPDTNTDVGVLVQDGVTAIVGDLRGQLTVVLAAVALVLVIATANVAGLTLTRAAARTQELAVRAALGAPRWHLLTSPVAESMVVAVTGGALGLGLSVILRRAIASRVSDLPRLDTIAFDWRVFAFSAGVIVATGLACGLVPALSIRRAHLDPLLRQRGGSHASSGRSLLVVAQVALALLLLVCAGVLASTLARLAADRGGIVADGVMTFDVRLPNDAPPDRAARFFADLDERLRPLPGVTALGAISVLPFSGAGAQSEIARVGDPPGHGARTDVAAVTPGYFAAMGVAVRRGRLFGPDDAAGRPAVAIVDTTLAERLFSGADPIGGHVRGWNQEDRRIVGVVDHVMNYGTAAVSREELYVPLAQQPRTRMFIVARLDADGALFVPAARRVVAALDPTLAIAAVRSMRQLVDGTIAGTRLSSLIGVSFSMAAVTLALIGLTGLVAYLVQLERREIGVRLALGATPSQVVGRLVARIGRLVAIGGGLGLGGGMLAVRLLRAQVAGVGHVGAGIVLLLPLGFVAIALAASWVPARRAARISPTICLRDE